MSVESQMMKEGAGARGVIGPLEGCFCLSHWKALMLFGLVVIWQEDGSPAVSRDESSRASPREEVESAGASAPHFCPLPVGNLTYFSRPFP